MDDQGFYPHNPFGAPPTTAEPSSPGQPLSPWHAPQPLPETSTAGAPGSGPPAMPLGPMPPAANPPSSAGAPLYPASPAYPPSPYPTYPGAASPAPTYPSSPGSPAYPAYPGSPSMPLPGTAPGAAGASASGSYPGAPSTAPLGTPYYLIGSAAYPTVTSSSQHSPLVLGASPQGRLARPFPLWLAAVIAGGSVALLVLAFLVSTLVARQDWAGGTFVAGIVAIMLALGGVALLVVRVAAGRHAGSAVALGVVGIVLLVAMGLGGLASTTPIHALQARSLEGGGSWSAAIHEYALSGEQTPNAPDIARVYNEWGESLLKQGIFSAAVDRFNTVVTSYAQSGTASQDRANRGLFTTYGRWITANDSGVPYPNAFTFVEQYAQTSACDSSCQTVAAGYAAQGRYQYGEQLLAQSSYQAATAQFEAVQSKYPTSTFAAQAHTEAAKAYLALGKQQISGDSCATDAVATYQTLAKRYADTPEGKQAQAALTAPVTVTGRLTGPYPRNPTPKAVLSKHIDPNSYYYSSEYTTGVDAGSGSFTFHNVRQGTYNFSTITYLPAVTDYVYWFDQSHNYYFVQVGPLCTLQIGDFQYPSS